MRLLPNIWIYFIAFIILNFKPYVINFYFQLQPLIFEYQVLLLIKLKLIVKRAMTNLLRQFLDQQQANLMICMLICIPISFLLWMIKQKYLFLALSMSITLAFQSFLFPVQKYFLWTQQQVVFLLILFAPRKKVGHIVLIESFLALFFVQIRRIYIAYGVNGVDITGIFMMQLFVWVGMAYNYQNGGQQQSTLSQDQKRRMIKERPSYITYIGYVNYLPACLIGPVYEYRDYEDYLNRVGDYVSIPSPLKAMSKQLLIFLGSLTVYVLTLRFQIQHILTQEFAHSSLIVKFIYIFANIFNIEFKYISAWSLGLISMKASGFTYNPSQNKIKSDGTVEEYNFDKVKITDFKKFYLEPSLKVKADGWNISVQSALKKYIYEQFYNPLKRYQNEKQRKKTMNKAQLITLMTSAIWHGFYLGYFITFFHWSLCLQISNQFYKFRVKNKKFAEIWQKYKILSILQNLTWSFLLCYIGMAVHLMLWYKIKVYLYETYALPYFLLYIFYFLIMDFKILNKLGDKPQKLSPTKKQS